MKYYLPKNIYMFKNIFKYIMKGDSSPLDWQKYFPNVVKIENDVR